MTLLPRSIKIDREYRRLHELAEKEGYESVYSMLYDLYIVKQTPLKELAKQLYTPMWTLRKRLVDTGIELRSRGGRNNVKVEVTRELLDEVSRDGIGAVAERLGITYASLNFRLREHVKKTP